MIDINRILMNRPNSLYDEVMKTYKYYGIERKLRTLKVEGIESFFLTNLDRKKYFILDTKNQLGLDELNPYNCVREPISARKNQLNKVKLSKRGVVKLFSDLDKNGKLDSFFNPINNNDTMMSAESKKMVYKLYRSENKIDHMILLYLLINGYIHIDKFIISADKFY